MLRRKKVSLLPYIREDVNNLSSVSQTYGWEIQKLNVATAWLKTKGEGITVAVLDTGCDLDHEDLKPNLLDGINIINKKSAPIDKAGHGTHVSSTIAAADNGKGMVGVAPRAKIVPVKVLDDDGQGDLKHVIDGIIWAVDRGVDFITMSLGSPSPAVQLQKALEYAHKKGVIVFCAAGNSGENSEIMYPAKYDYSLAIGAIDENFNRTPFSCSGQELDFLAPGQNILGCVPGNSYALMTGTSMSNPFATGCGVLLKSYYKQSGKLNKLKTIDDYINIFKQSALPLKDSRYHSIKKYEGYGIINPAF
jgi:major intracellular serine protease